VEGDKNDIKLNAMDPLDRFESQNKSKLFGYNRWYDKKQLLLNADTEKDFGN